MKRRRDFTREMLRMCGGYMERARLSAGDEHAKAIVMAVEMAVECLVWAIYREPACDLLLFKEAA